MVTPETAWSSSTNRGYSRMLSSARSSQGSRDTISPPGASMPAPAQLASPPTEPASTSVTRSPASASFQAMEAPMMPPPITIVSGEEEDMAIYHRKATLTAAGTRKRRVSLRYIGDLTSMQAGSAARIQ